MRDKTRIKRFCDKLAFYWENAVPDYRFGQLMSVFFGEYYADTHRDIFFPEDDEWSDFMDKFFQREGVSPYVGPEEIREKKERLEEGDPETQNHYPLPGF